MRSLWLSTVRAEVTTEGSISDLNFTVASAEVWEWLYHNEANLPHISPVSVQPVSQLMFGTHNDTVFLISLYGAPLAQRASYLALHSSLFGPVAQLVMIILSLIALTLS